MKIAKASELDIDAAVQLTHLIDGLTHRWDKTIPARQNDPEGDDIAFDIDNPTHCRIVVERLMQLFDRASIGRVVMGMLVLLDPANEFIDPVADTLEFHPHSIPAKDSRNTQALRDVLAERRRQVEQEGYDTAHDDEHDNGDMARAAAAFVLSNFGISVLAHGMVKGLEGRPLWPWAPSTWKPKDERANLVRAGALIVAEIERLDRVAALKGVVA